MEISCLIASMYAFNAESLLVGGVHELLLWNGLVWGGKSLLIDLAGTLEPHGLNRRDEL